VSKEPTYITLRELSDLMGWRWKEKTLRWAKREKVVFKVAGRWVTTKEKIIAVFPEALDKLQREAE
jgi:hypothetical protein